MATVTLADDWIHCVLSLASSPTPGGSVILMIVTFRRIVYSLRHQKQSCKKKKRNSDCVDEKQTLLLSLCATVVLLSLHREAQSVNKSCSETQRGQTEGSGVNVSPPRPDKRSPIICCCGSRPVAPL